MSPVSCRVPFVKLFPYLAPALRQDVRVLSGGAARSYGSEMISARDALERLREGIIRFVADHIDDTLTSPARRGELTDSQEPFAAILGLF